MRRILFMMLIASVFTISCSDDDSNNTANPNNPEQAQYNLTLTGSLQTNTCDIATNSYAVKIEYLSESEVSDTDEWSGTVQQNTSGSATLSGDIIGVRIKLTNFNANNADSGRGTGFNDIHLKITDEETNAVLLDQDRNEYLLLCTDAYYEVLYLYNTSSGQLTPTVQSHGF
jgi:hypothetical protein